ncbi:MAG: homocysteine S-methyltransferase family protein [Coriobacteriales bacterium]|jgi:5-methyltetrahydrofolate--homocysteine methyltransferase|nr:homocysteine S-methyltransferase family protein [Coriobacteriales bacterium]
MPDLPLRFNRDIIVVDGAMGTMLQREDVPSDECGMLLNVLDPEMIAGIHRQYRLAGAQALTTNSFGGTRAKLAVYGLADRLEELNRAAVRLARSAKPEHVLADVGPCGLVLEPLGSATFDEVFEQYAEQVRALAAENPDAILIETMADIADARCALLAAKSVCDLPVIVSCTFDATGHMELSGTTPEAAVVILESAGAAAIGMNCGLGPEQLLPLLERMAGATTLPLLIQPNAGLPQVDSSGVTYYTGTAEDFAEAAELFRRAGAQFVGSCCGSTPAFTSAIYATIGDRDVAPRTPSATFASSTLLASPAAAVALGGNQPTRIIGERINPTGKPAFAAELEKGAMSLALSFGEEQERAGANLIDVNVGAPMVDALVALPAVVRALQGFVVSPLVLDTTDYDALEAALRIYPGRALINSVNGDAASYERVFPLARTYGAAVIVLTLDETGIPSTVEGRLAIAERVREQAHRFGLRDKDLVFDVLTMAAASDEDAPETTLAGVKALTERGLRTVLGVSNVSHGLPERPALNAAFVAAAIAAGLSAAIANPNDPVMSESVRLANARRDTASFDDALAEWRAVYGQVMARLNSSVSAATDGAGTGAEGVRGTGPEAPDEAGQAEAPSPAALLRQAVLRGDRDATPALVDAVIAEGLEAACVVDKLLTPTLTELGEAFARGEAFLPQMMLAAGAMKVAVARIKEHLPETAADNIAGKVVFCTVKGDVHSIGKDICIALLESQGFKVFDLGVDVPIADVIETARVEDADVICLSALMTTTLPNMKATVEEVYRALPGFAAGDRKAVAVGGAVVTDRWAKSVNALYGPDAPSCVRLIQSIVNGEH